MNTSTATREMPGGGWLSGPNMLTIGRMVAAPPLVALLLLGDAWACWAAFGLYVFACLSDWLDGYWARRSGLVSVIGRTLDPIADKLLVAVVLVGLMANGTIQGWQCLAPALIFMREFTVAGLREGLAGDGFVLPVSFLGKTKTSVQMVALGLLLLPAVMPLAGLMPVALGLLWLATAMTVWSGLVYLHAAIGFMNRINRAAE